MEIILKSKKYIFDKAISLERKKAILYKFLLQKRKIWLTINMEEDESKPPRLKHVNGFVDDITENYNPIKSNFYFKEGGYYPIDLIFEAGFHNFNGGKTRKNDYNNGELFLELRPISGHFEEDLAMKYYTTLFKKIKKL